MRKILVTGGTVFVSRFVAEYYVKKGDEVYVLNRNSLPQSEGVKLIEADRHALGEVLKQYEFDVVLDITAYTEDDVRCLVEGLGEIKDYVLISSSAVYMKENKQPFTESQPVGENSTWGDYGTNKINAEKYLLERVPQAYILRPPYLYGPQNNLYREAFVFDCAELNRDFYVPSEGKMKLQFFHVEDMCRFIDIILEKKPQNHIFNVGNSETLTVNEWVEACYRVMGKKVNLVNVDKSHYIRNYFSFYDYEYVLDVSKQNELLDNLKPIDEGLKESYEWYKKNKELVASKDYIAYIDESIKGEGGNN